MCWASLTVPNAKLMEGKTMAAVASSKSRQPASVVHLAWLSYKKQLVKWPLRTKAITSACIASLSDVIAQRLMGSKYSFVGTVKMAIWGLCIGAPAAHFWHRYLQKWFAGKTDTFETALQKVILDQLTFGPIYNLCFMAYTAMVVNGMPPAAFQTKVVKDYPGLQMNGWKVWSLVGLVNYRFVPLQLRVLFANVVALFWSIFVILSSKSRVPLARSR